MNAKTILVGLASGAASAALSTALASGSILSLFLFLFAPLPIFIAALGWRHHAGFIGVVAGTVVLYALMGFETARDFLLSVGLPSWWLAYLALLGQPADPAQPEKGLAWYPVGRLLTWTASIGVVLAILVVVIHGGSVADYRSAMSKGLEAFFRSQTGSPDQAAVAVPGGMDIKRFADIAAIAIPPMMAFVWTLIAVLNLWVAGRVVRASGRLVRPWPDLAAFNLPPLTLFAFVGGVVCAALPGLFGFAAGVTAAAFSVAFTLLGLALLHAGTRNRPGRNLLLVTTYFLMAVMSWPILLIALLGVVEFLFGFRARIAAGPQPPRTVK